VTLSAAIKGCCVVAVIGSLTGCGQNFEDCILKNMEKAQTPQAAAFI